MTFIAEKERWIRKPKITTLQPGVYVFLERGRVDTLTDSCINFPIHAFGVQAPIDGQDRILHVDIRGKCQDLGFGSKAEIMERMAGIEVVGTKAINELDLKSRFGRTTRYYSNGPAESITPEERARLDDWAK